MNEHVEDHPLAELFPLMPDSDIALLADDIKANGQQHAIVLYEGKILDGRNRYRACNLARVEPKYAKFPGGDPLKFVLSRNLHRRHLTDAQRAMVAAKIANMKRGDKSESFSENVEKCQQKSGENKSATLRITQEDAAKALDVSVRSVQTAKAIIEADPKKAEEVASGKKKLAAAEREIKEAAKPKEKPSDKLPKDERGVMLPADKVKLWERRGEVGELASAVSRVRVTLRKAQEKNDPLYCAINFSSCLAQLDQAYADLTSAKPWCVCPMCQGDGCRTCRKSGLLGKFGFDKFVPSEFKKDGK